MKGPCNYQKQVLRFRSATLTTDSEVMMDDGTAYFVPYAANHIGVFDVHSEGFSPSARNAREANQEHAS